jgi:raffinose/stachyose/melibiose transport system permease protein
MSSTSLEESIHAAPALTGKRIRRLHRLDLRQQLTQNWRIYLMLAPNFILFVVFSIYPIMWALRFMFYDWDGVTAPTYIGLGNFVRVLTRDPVFWKSVTNTFAIAICKIGITIPLALVLAAMLNEKLRGRGILRTIYFMPTIMSAAVMSLVFYIIFNPYNGAANQLLKSIGAVSKPIDWLGVGYAMFTVIIVAVWGAVGNYMVLFLAGLQTIPQELYEAAEIDGANKTQQFFNITVPQLSTVTRIVMLLAIINTFKGYESIMVLTGGGPADKTQVMFLYVYKLFFPLSVGDLNYQPQYGYGAAVGVVASVILGIITIAYLWSSRRANQQG